VTAPSEKDREAVFRALKDFDLLADGLSSDEYDALFAALSAAVAQVREEGRAERDALRREVERQGYEWLKAHDGEWCCCTCGPSKTSRADWCGRGCGSDYNAMIRIDHWRMGRLFKLAIRAENVARERREDR
jgi:hypothetical protein